MSHPRLTEHPANRSTFGAGVPKLYITGDLPAAKPSLAYEGQLAIVNLDPAAAEVVSVAGTLPPGATVTVDNASNKVVVAWPAYQAGAAPIPNADFEQGDTQWLKGPGWSIVQNDVNDDPTTPASQWAAKFANQGGNVELRNAVRAPVTAGQPISASCRVQQGASSEGNAAAAVRLFFLPASGAEVMREGNLVDSGSNSEWKTSTLNTTAPVTGTVSIGCRGKRHRQNKPLWVDNFAWNVTQPSVGTNAEGTIGPITIRIRDTLGREAEWTGSVEVATATAYLLRSSHNTLVRSYGARTWNYSNVTAAWSGANGERLFAANGKLFVTNGSGSMRVLHAGATAWANCTGVPSNNIYRIIWAPPFGAHPGRYVCFGSSAAATGTSLDGEAWAPLAVEARTYYGVAAKDGVVVASSTLGAAIRSTDNAASFGASFYIGLTGRIIATLSRFIAMGGASQPFRASLNGADGTWFDVANPMTGSGAEVDMAHNGAGLVVAVSQDGKTAYSVDDGVTFVAGPDLALQAPGITDCSIACAGGTFAIVGRVIANFSSRIFTTTDGATITLRHTSGNNQDIQGNEASIAML